jgi:predicted Mrr-cat superfamily restriction endonuclease
LWGPDDLIRELLSAYPVLNPEIRNELPLKQVWVVAGEE